MSLLSPSHTSVTRSELTVIVQHRFTEARDDPDLVMSTHRHYVPFRTQESRQSRDYTNRLPTELLQDIFSRSCDLEQLQSPTSYGISGDLGRSKRFIASGNQHDIGLYPLTPVILAGVCRRWRYVAQATTKIWSLVYVEAKIIDAKNVKLRDLCEDLTRRLVLAASRPLNITLHVPPDSVTSARALIDTIIPFSPFWHTIHLHVPTSALTPLTRLQSHDVSLLHSLRLQEKWDSLNNISTSVSLSATLESISLYICSVAPHLRRLWLSQFPRSTPDISFSHLAEIFLEFSSETSRLLALLKQCPNLQALSLSGYGLSIFPVEQDLIVILPHLHSLHLEHPGGRTGFLQHITAPSLQHLAITGVCNPVSSRPLLHVLLDLFARSGSSLTSLFIHMFTHGFEHEPFIQFLQQLPTLQSLVINEQNMICSSPIASDVLLLALTMTLDGVQLCPRLRKFKLVECRKFSDDVLRGLLKTCCRELETTFERLEHVEVFPGRG